VRHDAAAHCKAARALLSIDQRQLAEASGLSLPTIQRMESSKGTIRGNADPLVKLIAALSRESGRWSRRAAEGMNQRRGTAPAARSARIRIANGKAWS
jgi:transcriptional regulator with XRE-family HTH domain